MTPTEERRCGLRTPHWVR